MKKSTVKITGAILFLFSLILVSNKLKAQEIDKKLCQEFLAANELYLINSPENTVKLTTGSGRTFTFEQLVQENWPSKKIIKIDEKEYNKLKDLKNKFHIMISAIQSWRRDPMGVDYQIAEIDGITIRQGKTLDIRTATGFNFNEFYWLQLNLDEILKGEAPERLIYAVENIKNILVNYNDKSIKDKGLYKCVGYKDILKTDTLYVKHGDSYYTAGNSEYLKRVYPYPFKIVSKEQWQKAISEARPNVLFTDYVRSGYFKSHFEKNKIVSGFYSAVYVYQAKDGKLIIATYPLRGHDHIMGPQEFKKIAK